MKRRAELIAFAALVAMLAAAVYWGFGSRTSAGDDGPVDISVLPLRVENPSLHLEKLDKLRQLTYTGTRRNIFSATPPPPPAPVTGKDSKDAAKPGVTTPPPPPPLQVPLTFYGEAVDSRSGKKLAFFTDGDDVYIASVGQTLLSRFRLVSVGQDTAVVEEISSGRRATLTMAPPEAE